jgi:hypothetical protein
MFLLELEESCSSHTRVSQIIKAYNQLLRNVIHFLQNGSKN